jgi:hypothetical protein
LHAAADSIGGISELIGTPGSITRTSGETFTADASSDIVSMDNVETTNGRMKIQFVDDTRVSLTEHTVLEINEYVYDPNPSNSRMALNFAQGTARFATGKLGLVPRENIQIQTPTASIGIRGTDFTTTVDELGRSLVILLPDEDCTDKIKLEQGCKPSGSISVTNDGGTVILDEAYQAVMVSTFETAPTQPVVLVDLDLNMIDNMFIVSEPKEVTEAREERIQQQSGSDYLDFDGLDQDFLEENLLQEEDLEFTELDIDNLNVNLLGNLLDALEFDEDPLSDDQLRERQFVRDKITGTVNPGYDDKTMYNTIIEEGRGILFLRIIDGYGKISLRIPAGSNARIETDAEPTKSIICVNDCGGINIFIRQTQG